MAGGVLDRVRGCLLDHPIRAQLHRGAGPIPRAGQLDGDRHATGPQLGHEVRDVGDARNAGGAGIPGPFGEHSQHLAHLAHRRATCRFHDPDGCPGGARIAGVQGQPSSAGLDRHNAEPMADDVMQIPGNPQSLLRRGPLPYRLDPALVRARQHRGESDQRSQGHQQADAPAPGWATSATAISRHVATVVSTGKRRGSPGAASADPVDQITTQGPSGGVSPTRMHVTA